MNRLLILFNKIQKRHIVNCILFLLMGIFAVNVFAIDYGNTYIVPINDATVDLTPTDQLVIELPDLEYLSAIYRYALMVFQVRYPDVKVTLTYMGGKNDYTLSQYQKAIGTEIMAGVGLDVILTDYFPDLYKTMDSGAFVNLNSIISGDSDFHIDDYNAVVMNAGYYKGGQYIMPIGYELPTLMLAETGLLEKVGFDASKPLDTISFLNEIEDVLLTWDDGYVERYGIGSSLLATSGIPLIDLETKTVPPDESAFRTFCEAYQPFYEMDNSTIIKFYSYFYLDDIMMDGKLLFIPIVYPFGGSRIMEKGGSPINIPIHSIDGGLVASAKHGLAINANSKNQLNAWNFIKIVLSEEIQTSIVTKDQDFSRFNAYPVNNAALDEFMQIKPQNINVYFSDEYRQWYTDMLNSITVCKLPQAAISDMFYTRMEPYFKGQQSLDSCISEFKSSLTIYSSE